jgi:hypothetical protein
MLASTMQHSTHNHTPTHTSHHHTHTQECVRRPSRGPEETPHKRVSPQDPTVCQALMNQHYVPPSATPPTTSRMRLHRRKENQPQHSRAGQPHQHGGLLRKEVIQPHLPVRLPCYDFVPIASPTFDDSLPQGVRPSASGVTNFRDVTGGVYKARERIHRSVADLRLLATPTSRGRVADPDPN